MAIQHRDPVAGATLIHSDHGTQFTSWAFQSSGMLVITRIRQTTGGHVCNEVEPVSAGRSPAEQAEVGVVVG